MGPEAGGALGALPLSAAAGGAQPGCAPWGPGRAAASGRGRPGARGQDPRGQRVPGSRDGSAESIALRPSRVCAAGETGETGVLSPRGRGPRSVDKALLPWAPAAQNQSPCRSHALFEPSASPVRFCESVTLHLSTGEASALRDLAVKGPGVLRLLQYFGFCYLCVFCI